MESFPPDLYRKAKDYLTSYSSDKKKPKKPLVFTGRNAGDEFPIGKIVSCGFPLHNCFRLAGFIGPFSINLF